MEQVDVYRGTPTLDADGNTVQGPLELVASFPALVAPATTPESGATDSAGVTWDHTIYIRSCEPTGILDTDLIGVRGRRVPVDGVVAQWRNRVGNYVGDVVNVKLQEG